MEVYNQPDSPTVLGENDILTGGEVLPGFSLSLKDFFADPLESGQATAP